MGQIDDMMCRISAFAADQAPNWAIDGYMAGLTAQIAQTPAFLNRVSRRALTRPGNTIFLYHNSNIVLAGLYAKPHNCAGTPVIDLNGLYSHASQRGVGQRLIDRAVRVMRAETAIRRFEARIRVLPRGEINAPAARVFCRSGFWPAEILRYAIADNPSDTHLYDFAEADGATYQAMTLRLEGLSHG